MPDPELPAAGVCDRSSEALSLVAQSPGAGAY